MGAPSEVPGTEPSFAQLCAKLAAAFDGLLPFDRVALATVGPDGDVITLRGSWSRVPDGLIPSRYSGRLDGSSLADVRAGGEPRIIADLREYVRSHPSSRTTTLLIDAGYRSSLTCPLGAVGSHEGGFLFFNSLTPSAYDSEHVGIFSRLAVTVGGLLGEVDGGLSVVEARIESLVRGARRIHGEEGLMARVLRVVNRGVGLTEVLDHVYESFTALLPYDRIGFAVVDWSSGVVEVRWARSNGLIHLGVGFRRGIDESSLPGVIAADAPDIVRDLAAWAEAHPGSIPTRLMLDEGMRSSLTWALGPRERPFAFLFFSSRQRDAYQALHAGRLRRMSTAFAALVEKELLIDELARERGRADQLLHQLIPREVALRLKRGEDDIAELFDVTAIFADLVDFTRWSADLAPTAVMQTLRGVFSQFDRLAAAAGVYKLRSMGDAWIAISGLPEPRPDHAVAAARLALRMMEVMKTQHAPNGHKIEMRVGLHSGQVVAGVMGGADPRYDAWGPALSVASRMETHGKPGRVRISPETAARLPPEFVVTEGPLTEVRSLGLVRTLWLDGC